MESNPKEVRSCPEQSCTIGVHYLKPLVDAVCSLQLVAHPPLSLQFQVCILC